MKKFVLLPAMLVLSGFYASLNAQCSESNLGAIIKTVTSTPGGCQVTMDISFTGNFNSGNKYAFIHLWESSPVDNYPSLSYTNPPTASELASAIGTIVIVDPGKSSAALYDQYVPNTSVPVSYSGVGFTKSGSTYTLTDVMITLPDCSQAATIKGDVWSSQSSDAQVVHCFNRGTITALLNNTVITGFKQCVSPRLLNLSFANTDASLSESVEASVFIDNNNNGQIDAGDIDITGSLSPALPNPIGLGANSSQSFTGMSYLPYSGQAMYDGKPIIVKSVATAPGAATVTNTKNNIDFLGSCILLPVTFKSFTASKNNSIVSLKWETASEQNSNGFAVERNSNGLWQEIAFVPSKAFNGSSSVVLKYQYDDVNIIKSTAQYRIRQMDMDARASYSEVRIIRPEGQAVKTIVYPNPSDNGKVTIVFLQTDVMKDVVLLDMSGRMVKKWSSISDNSIGVDHLAPGMYSLRVVVQETGEQSVNKIVVSSR